jgi:hypothetical protein
MSHHIDEFSKSLANESIPRRDTFRLLGAALAGAVLSPLGLRTAWAGGPDPCRAFCNQCPKWQRQTCLAACQACVQASGRICGTCSGFDCCHDSETCCGKTCCGASQSCCGDYCADLANDVRNCGACFNDCWSGAVANEEAACTDGKCVYGCPPGTVDCDGTCRNLGWDPDNCGACGNVCPDTEPYCNGNGVCFDPGCGTSQTWCQGVCTFTDWDNNNCGTCNHQCDGNTFCVWGRCEGAVGDPGF